MSETASAPAAGNPDVSLRYPGGELPLRVVPATEGSDGLDTGKLLSTTGQVALAWLLHQPAMTAPIIGASSPEQVRENAKASGVSLSADEMARIETILKGPDTK